MTGGGARARRPAPFVQGQARRYRFVYEKLGASAFLSHLDLIRLLPRAFRRAELPLYYSQGFHPKADMTFCPALSLGVASLGEVVDIKLTCDGHPEAWLDALTAGSPAGLRFVEGRALDPNDAAISRRIVGARYVVAVPRAVLAERGGDAWVRERVGHVRAASSLTVVRRIAGVGKRVDVREYLERIDLGGAPLLARAGITGDVLALTIDVAIRGSGSVKISEVMETLGDVEYHAVRAQLLLSSGHPELAESPGQRKCR
jgi:radical SAM-linked protein